MRGEILSCYERHLVEREVCPPAEDCDFVLVNLRHEPLDQTMTPDTVRKWLTERSRRAGLDRALRSDMFRHATANEFSQGDGQRCGEEAPGKRFDSCAPDR